jgi:catechol 2,3-dioxygenase-like lactoylglutathione lyase family enzyme
MHQEAYPGEDIRDRPPPEASVPGLIELIEGDHPSGRYRARSLPQPPEAVTPGVDELRFVIKAADYEETVALYRDGLGLKAVEQWDRADGRGIVLAAGQATVEVLDQAEADRVEVLEAGSNGAGPLRLAFRVGDVGSASAGLRKHGAEVVQGPVHTPWNHLNQRLRLPDGLPVTVFRPLSESETAEAAT